MALLCSPLGIGGGVVAGRGDTPATLDEGPVGTGGGPGGVGGGPGGGGGLIA